ncbi:MAG: class I SAM-dependent methyltransferase [Candidatus Methylumidiphilus sp.]
MALPTVYGPEALFEGGAGSPHPDKPCVPRQPEERPGASAQLPGDSAAAFYVEGTLDIDRWFQVADADYRAVLDALDIDALLPPAQALRLLDVGCGTGRFPAMLRARLTGRSEAIEYDFVDPAPHCLRLMRESLAYPYQAGRGLPLRAQDLDACETGRYDVVWAIHSLYYVAAAAVPDVVRNLRRLLAPETGVGLIYIASRDSFYLQIHEAYRQVFATSVEPFLSAEHYADAFAALVVPHQQKRLRYFHEIPVEDHALLESYLHKCVLDPAQPLFAWWRHAPLRELIEGYRDGEVYRFPQEAALFQFGA